MRHRRRRELAAQLAERFQHAASRRDWATILAARNLAETFIAGLSDLEVEIKLRAPIAVALLRTSDPACLPEFERCLHLATEAGDETLRASLLGDLSRYYRTVEIDYDHATRITLEAREIYLREGSVDGVGTCELDLGNLAEYQGDHERAADYYRSAALTLERRGPSRHLAAAWNYLATVEADRESYHTAFEASQAEAAVLANLPRETGALRANWDIRVRLATFSGAFDQAANLIGHPGPGVEPGDDTLDELRELLARGREIHEELSSAASFDASLEHLTNLTMEDVALVRAYGQSLGVLHSSSAPTPAPRIAFDDAVAILDPIRARLQLDPADSDRAIEFASILREVLHVVSSDRSRLEAYVETLSESADRRSQGHTETTGILLEQVSQVLRDSRYALSGNDELAIIYARRAFRILRRHPDPNARSSATLTLANAIRLCGSDGSRAVHRSLWLMRLALRVPGISAETATTVRMNLGLALSSTEHGQSIAAEEAIEHLERADYSLPASADRAALNFSLANLYASRLLGDFSQNLDRAIDRFSTAADYATMNSDFELHAWSRLREARARSDRDMPEDWEAVSSLTKAAAQTLIDSPPADPWARASIEDELAMFVGRRASTPQEIIDILSLHISSAEYFSSARTTVEYERALVNRADSLAHLAALTSDSDSASRVLAEALGLFGVVVESSQCADPGWASEVALRRARALVCSPLSDPALIAADVARAQEDIEGMLSDNAEEATPVRLELYSLLGGLARLSNDGANEVAHYDAALAVAERLYERYLLPRLRAQLLRPVGDMVIRAALANLRRGTISTAVLLLEKWTTRFLVSVVSPGTTQDLSDELAQDLREAEGMVRRLSVVTFTAAGSEAIPSDLGPSAQREALARLEQLRGSVSEDALVDPEQASSVGPLWPGTAVCRVVSDGLVTAIIASANDEHGSRLDRGLLLDEIDGTTVPGGLVEPLDRRCRSSARQEAQTSWADATSSERSVVNAFYSLLAEAAVAPPTRVAVVGGSGAHGAALASSQAWEDATGGCAPPVVSWVPSEVALVNCVTQAGMLSSADRTFSSLGHPPTDLTYAQAEVADLVSRWGLEGGSGTFLHLAAHGLFLPESPFDSVIKFADRELSLGEALLSAEFADRRVVVLGACMTAESRNRIGALEPLGFAVAALAAGCAGVVATVGSVDDLAASLIASRLVYQIFVEGLRTWDSMDLAGEVDLARRWLRSATARELVDWLEQHPKLKRTAQRLDDDLMTSASTEPDATPFRAPEYWRPFVAIGC